MYDYSYYTTDDVAAVGVLAGLAGMASVIAIISFIIGIVTLVGLWKIFTKAGEKGWKAIIPIYNLVILFKIAGISPLFILGYLAAIIPGIGGLVVLGISIYAMINLSKSFGKTAGFTVGLILLEPIFICILGFGSAQYQGTIASAEKAE